ncbi:helix-turn-helix domain-containing protein [Oceanimonas doudoroffii]|uniref:Transcriptional regulator n=1 Tax=Oceanimonas doudoroffii TaxID=84158 RepID=A0A233RDK3_9GAMM|nr:helix-turn-helix transcriptional regulator [Oceanimonas doudoroffii]OXY81466.1 transcriptional regulator [Oceanimonas doudoroffii]
MSELAEAVGLKIRHQRKIFGVSQETLAHLAKVDRSYVGRVERGEVNLTIDMLYKLAQVLECDPKGLLP